MSSDQLPKSFNILKSKQNGGLLGAAVTVTAAGLATTGGSSRQSSSSLLQKLQLQQQTKSKIQLTSQRYSGKLSLS